jgi:hypothetical protein
MPIFPDNEQYADALEQAAIRLRQTDAIGFAAQELAEQRRLQIASSEAELTSASAELSATRIVLADLREKLQQAQQWWFAPLREELAHEEYTTPVSAKNAVECLRLLRVPTLEPANEIPAARLRVQLSPMRVRLKSQPAEVQAFWNATLDDVTQFTSITMNDPLTRSLLDAAQQLGLLTAEEVAALGTLPQSPLERLGLAQVVTAPAHIVQAMGW